jgi:hypothetical protein
MSINQLEGPQDLSFVGFILLPWLRVDHASGLMTSSRLTLASGWFGRLKVNRLNPDRLISSQGTSGEGLLKLPTEFNR